MSQSSSRSGGPARSPVDDGGSSVRSAMNRPRTASRRRGPRAGRGRAAGSARRVRRREHRLEEAAQPLDLRAGFPARAGARAADRDAATGRRERAGHGRRFPLQARRARLPARARRRRPCRRPRGPTRRAAGAPGTRPPRPRVLERAGAAPAKSFTWAASRNQAAVLHERDVAAGQLDLEHGRCGGAARKRTACCRSGDAALAVVPGSAGRPTSPARPRRGSVAGAAAAPGAGPQRLVVALRRQRDDGVRRGQDRASTGSSARASRSVRRKRSEPRMLRGVADAER